MVVTTSTPKLAPPSPTKPTMSRHHQNNNMCHLFWSTSSLFDISTTFWYDSIASTTTIVLVYLWWVWPIGQPTKSVHWSPDSLLKLSLFACCGLFSLVDSISTVPFTLFLLVYHYLGLKFTFFLRLLWVWLFFSSVLHFQLCFRPHYLFVAKINIATKPKGTCCFGLEVLPKKSNAQFGVVLNVTKANTFFVACKVSSPSPQQESNAPTSGLNGPMNEISLAPTPA